jgi:exopolysaccharide biosynthesis protein
MFIFLLQNILLYIIIEVSKKDLGGEKMVLKRKTKALIICTIILDAFMCIGLFILYGPWPNFRNFWITTAMTTMNHQYLAHLFYSTETINEVLANNTIIEVDEDTDISLIDYNSEYNETHIYSDIYEKQVLKRDKNNNLYKVIDIEGNNYKGFLVVIYDPSKISLAMTRYLNVAGEEITKLSKENEALVAINASGFEDTNEVGNGGTPTGSIIQNGKLVYSSPSPGRSGGIIGFDYNNHLILTKDSIKTAKTKYNLRDAVEFGPFLIVNGKASFIKGNGGWGVAPRTVIGQRADGIVLFLIIDGRRPGYSIGTDMNELTKIMTNYKAINATNLDGGASTGLVVENKVVNKPCGLRSNGLRRLPNAWIVTE